MDPNGGYKIIKLSNQSVLAPHVSEVLWPSGPPPSQPDLVYVYVYVGLGCTNGTIGLWCKVPARHFWTSEASKNSKNVKMKGVQSITTCLYVVGPRRQLQETEQIWKQNTLKSAAKRLKDHPVCRGKDTASEAHCSLLESTIEQTILESTIEQTKQGVPRAGNSQLHTPCNRQDMLDARIPNDRCFSPPCDENVAKKKRHRRGHCTREKPPANWTVHPI